MILAVVVFFLRLLVFHGGYSESMRSAASVLVIANTASLVIARALTWYCAIGGAYRCGVMVRSVRALQKLLQTRAVVLDDSSITDADLPTVSAIKSAKLNSDLLLKLAAHAESQSESRTARAIIAAYPDDINPSLIEKTLDIPDNGVESYVNGLRICVGTRELMILKGITIPDEDITDDYSVYVQSILYVCGVIRTHPHIIRTIILQGFLMCHINKKMARSSSSDRAMILIPLFLRLFSSGPPFCPLLICGYFSHFSHRRFTAASYDAGSVL